MSTAALALVKRERWFYKVVLASANWVTSRRFCAFSLPEKGRACGEVRILPTKLKLDSLGLLAPMASPPTQDFDFSGLRSWIPPNITAYGLRQHPFTHALLQSLLLTRLRLPMLCQLYLDVRVGLHREVII